MAYTTEPRHTILVRLHQANIGTTSKVYPRYMITIRTSGVYHIGVLSLLSTRLARFLQEPYNEAKRLSNQHGQAASWVLSAVSHECNYFSLARIAFILIIISFPYRSQSRSFRHALYTLAHL